MCMVAMTPSWSLSKLYVKLTTQMKHRRGFIPFICVVDDLLTKDEVRNKVLHGKAAHHCRHTVIEKFECGDLPIDTAGRRLDEDDRGEVRHEVESNDLFGKARCSMRKSRWPL